MAITWGQNRTPGEQKAYDVFWSKTRPTVIKFQDGGRMVTAKVKVAFWYFHDDRPYGFKTMKGNIDWATTPEPEIQIWIGLESITEGYNVSLRRSKPSKFNGFTWFEGGRSGLTQERQTAVYKYRFNQGQLNPNRNTGTIDGTLAIVRDKSTRPIKSHTFSIDYTLLNLPSGVSPNPTALPADFTLDDIRTQFNMQGIEELCEQKETILGSIEDNKTRQQAKRLIEENCTDPPNPGPGPNPPDPKPNPDLEKKKRATRERIEKNFSVSEYAKRKKLTDGRVEINMELEGIEGARTSISMPEGSSSAASSTSKYTLTVPDGTEIEFTIEVFGPSMDRKLSFVHTLSTRIPKLEGEFRETENGYLFTRSPGTGEPPFTLKFYDENGGFAGRVTLASVDESRFPIIGEDASKAGLVPGKYKMVVTDKYSSVESAETFDYSSTPIGRYIGFGAAFLVLLGVIFLIYRRYRKDQEPSRDYKGYTGATIGRSRPETGGEEPPVEAPPTEDSKEGAIRKKITISPKSTSLQPQTPGLLTGPTIHPLTRIPQNGFLEYPPSKYRTIKMNDLWTHSTISKIHISEVCALMIHRFVFEESYSPAMLERRGEAIPEVGGWLLGRKYLDSYGKYVVSLERFVKIGNPQGHTETQVTFGAGAWVKLEEAQEMLRREEDINKGSGIELVGWFHTHPGWGVFLSGEDENTHKSFFTSPHHIAMELDSLKNNHEVGFFTWQEVSPDGKIGIGLNNKPHLKEAYHKWGDFKKWLRIPS